MNYIIKQSDNIYGLMESVNAAMEDGWVPQGGVMHLIKIGMGGGTLYSQAMIKRDGAEQ